MNEPAIMDEPAINEAANTLAVKAQDMRAARVKWAQAAAVERDALDVMRSAEYAYDEAIQDFTNLTGRRQQ